MDTENGVDETTPDVNGLIAELQARVEQRRQDGFYPPDLEEAMTTHARRMLHHHTTVPQVLDLRTHLRRVEAALSFDAGRIPAGSGIPGGELVHKTVAKVVSRQTSGALAEVEAFARPVRDALGAVIEALEEFMGAVRADLDTLYGLQAAQERALVVATGLPHDGARPEAD